MSKPTQPSTRATEPSPFLTVTEAAQYLRCSKTFVYRAVESGTLRVHRLGTAIRITRADLDALLSGATESTVSGRPGRKRAR